MMGYDFNNIFEPMEFQDFARDMVQMRDEIFFESFARGADQGIDGRHVQKDGSTIILQVKWGRSTSGTILRIAQKEKEKMDRLTKEGVKICRYILVFACDISEISKSKIMKLFSPYITDVADIITGSDLNNLLSSENGKYHSVETKYYNLLIPSTEALKRTLYEVVHSPLVERSKMKLEEAIEKSRFFVETDVYEDALKKMQRSRTLIISGEPGVGKTTLANQVALYYYTKYGFSSFIYVTSVEELYTVQSIDGKKAIVFDDFWGDTGFDAVGNGRKSKDLISFIEHIQKHKNCILIITTREYILEQGLKKNEEFRRLVETHKLECRIKQYSREDKLRIYYGHLKYGHLTWEQMRRLVNIGSEIIYSPNYNPRVIEKFIQSITPEMTPGRCEVEFLQYLDCPMDFWKRIFEELSQEAKTIYLLMADMPLPIERTILEDCYYEVLKENKKSLEWKGFSEVLVELEKTVIRTDLYNQDGRALYAVTFQNPSVKDFIQDILKTNLAQYHDMLLKSCNYFTQCIEYLKILQYLKDEEARYQQVMAKAIKLLDSESIIFYTKYKRVLQVNGKEEQFLQTYRTRHTVGELGFGRLNQLFMLYNMKKCPDLKEWFEKAFSMMLQIMERYPDSLLKEDVENFPDAAVSMAQEGIYQNQEKLIAVYMDCLMRNRMELEGKGVKQSFREEWIRYKELHKKEILVYLEKFYVAELCLAAAQKDEDMFSDLMLECEDKFFEFGLEIPAFLQTKMQMYGQWVEKDRGKGDDEEETDADDTNERPNRTKWTLKEIEEEFEEEYINGIFSTEVEDLDDWLWMREIPEQIKSVLKSKEVEENEYWTSFLYEEESLEFLIGFIQWSKEVPEDCLTELDAIARYIAEQSKASTDTLGRFFSLFALTDKRYNVFSKEELELLSPELFVWDDKIITELENIHALVHRQNWYYLSNDLLALSFHINSLRNLQPEEIGKYFVNVLLEDDEIEEVNSERDGYENLIEIGRKWIEKIRLEREFVTSLYQLAPDIFADKVIVPLAEEIYNKGYASIETDIVGNLVDQLEIEFDFAEDGALMGGSASYDKFFWIVEMIYDLNFLDVFPEEPTADQLKILIANAEQDGEAWKVSVAQLKERGLLEYFGIYDKILLIWNKICLWKSGERSNSCGGGNDDRE